MAGLLRFARELLILSAMNEVKKNVMKRLELQIHGCVQGVAFRWYTQRKARTLGVTGWVRNVIDGTVRVVAEGDPVRLQLLAEWAQHGPDHARVDRVDTFWSEAAGQFTTFEITG